MKLFLFSSTEEDQNSGLFQVAQKVQEGLLSQKHEVATIPEYSTQEQQLYTLRKQAGRNDIVLSIQSHEQEPQALTIVYCPSADSSRKKAQMLLEKMREKSNLPMIDIQSDIENHWPDFQKIQDIVPWLFLLKVPQQSLENSLYTEKIIEALEHALKHYLERGDSTTYSGKEHLRTEIARIDELSQLNQLLLEQEQRHLEKDKMIRKMIRALLRKRSVIKPRDISKLIEKIDSQPDEMASFISQRLKARGRMSQKKIDLLKLLCSDS